MDLYPGLHPLTAVATDNLGLAVTSTAVSVTVTSTPIANPIADRIPKGDITVELRTIADGMISPLGMAVPDDGSGRIFVYDQAGLVWLVTASGRSPKPVLDLRTRLVNISGNYDERGLLGLALHTNFAQFPYSVHLHLRIQFGSRRFSEQPAARLARTTISRSSPSGG